MPDGSTPATSAGNLSEILEAIEERLNRDERGDALALVAKAKRLAAIAEEVTLDFSAEEDNGVDSVLRYIRGNTSHDTVHNATCMLEYVREGDAALAEQTDVLNEDTAYGRWLIDTTIAKLLRYGLRQQKQRDELGADRTGSGLCLGRSSNDDDHAMPCGLGPHISDAVGSHLIHLQQDLLAARGIVDLAISKLSTEESGQDTECALRGAYDILDDLFDRLDPVVFKREAQPSTAHAAEAGRSLPAFTSAQRALLAKGLAKVLNDCKTGDEFNVAIELEEMLALRGATVGAACER